MHSRSSEKKKLILHNLTFCFKSHPEKFSRGSVEAGQKHDQLMFEAKRKRSEGLVVMFLCKVSLQYLSVQTVCVV